MKKHKVLTIMPILLVCACFAVHGRGGREDEGDWVSQERSPGEFTGNIHYKGNPRMNMDVHGVGHIKRIK